MTDAALEPTGGTLPLLTPRDGVPSPTDTPAGLIEARERLEAGSGPIAVDVERASAYRYGARAYLIQLRREGSGTLLLDPVAYDGLSDLAPVMCDAEWVLHAAHQDLPSLDGEGLRPTKVFDTELAGRLLGYPRVNLGVMVADILGFELEKGHSAADWSKRPLPEPWLRYAALDVELLLELRDAVEAELREAGKLTWAQQEFDALVVAPPPAPKTEPWRKVRGLHRLRRGRQLAVARELWLARDAIARERDTAPGRILPDATIVEAALKPPRNGREFFAMPSLANTRSGRKDADTWIATAAAAMELDNDQLPDATPPHVGPPPPRSWPDRNPPAAARLARARAALAEVSAQTLVPVENLLSPETVRRLSWTPPREPDVETVTAFLRDEGARPWQVELSAEALFASLDGPDTLREKIAPMADESESSLAPEQRATAPSPTTGVPALSFSDDAAS